MSGWVLLPYHHVQGEVFVGALDGGKCRIVVGELVLEAPQFKVTQRLESKHAS